MLRVAGAALLLFLVALPGAAQTVPLTVGVGGNTSGTVAVIGVGGGLCSTPSSSQCVFQIPTGSAVTVAANAPSGQTPGRLANGSGPAAGCTVSTCTFTMTSAAAVTATFTAGDGPVAALTTALAGDGTGAAGAGNSRCQNFDPGQASSCATVYLQGSGVTLTSTAAASSRFAGYSAASGSAAMCGTNATCQFTLNADSAVTASFVALTSIAVTPSTAAKLMGEPQTFTAVGTYSDGESAAIVPGTGTWTTRQPMPTARELLGAAEAGGKLYAVGGRADGAPTGAAEVYDPATNTWSPLASLRTPREGVAVASYQLANYGTLLAAVGGVGADGAPSAKFEWYDLSANTWYGGLPLATARSRSAMAASDGRLFVIGGETLVGGTRTAVGTLEAYNGSEWFTSTPMPTPRESLAAVAVRRPAARPVFFPYVTFRTFIYAIGGNAVGGPPLATVEAYDTSDRTWSTKGSMPSGLSGVAAAVDDSVIYVTGTQADGTVVTYRYDVELDTWSADAAPPAARTAPAGASINGLFYILGGRTGTGDASGALEVLTEPLQWTSSAPEVAHVTQQGVGTGIWAGSAQIRATAGNVTCAATCATLTVATLPSDLTIDTPASGATVGSPFVVSGWAINRSATDRTGVDSVTIYAYPAGSSTALLLGVASKNRPRPDIGAMYGTQFTNSGFTLTVSLAPGSYTIVAYAHNGISWQYDAVKVINLTVATNPPHIYIDTPAAAATVTSAFEVGGWAADTNAPSGTGVDGVQFYVQPQGAAAPGVLIGSGSYGLARPDVGAALGSRFTNSGYHFTITGLPPGLYTLYVYAHSTLTGSYSIVKSTAFSVSATALMSIDAPSAEATISASSFLVGGWSMDRNVEGTALSGSGVDTLHVYAYPNPGSGQAPIFIGVATVDIFRPDVGAAYGSRYNTSGYGLTIDRAALGLAPGVYNIAVHSHSAVSGTFNNVAVVRVTLQ